MLHEDIALLKEELQRNRLDMRHLAHNFSELENALHHLSAAAELLDSIGSEKWVTLLKHLEELNDSNTEGH